MRLSSIAGGQIIHSQCRRKYATRCSGRDTGLVRVRVRVRVRVWVRVRVRVRVRARARVRG